MAGKKRIRAPRTTKTPIVLLQPNAVEPGAFGDVIADFVVKEIGRRDAEAKPATKSKKKGAKK